MDVQKVPCHSVVVPSIAISTMILLSKNGHRGWGGHKINDGEYIDPFLCSFIPSLYVALSPPFFFWLLCGSSFFTISNLRWV